jgi:hypothetical protein
MSRDILQFSPVSVLMAGMPEGQFSTGDVRPSVTPDSHPRTHFEAR